jgi:uncharacterized membrane protein
MMFGSFKRKITKWEQAGLISPDQSAAIVAFEKEKKGRNLSVQLSRVGIIAIFLGVLSLVAANWQGISPEFKLIGHFVLNAAVAFFILRQDVGQHKYRRDFGVLLLFGLFLTFIALIGQIFQLHGEHYTTLLFWFSICTPFILYFGRTFITAGAWLAVLLVTLYWNVAEQFSLNDDAVWLFISVFSFYLPALLLLVGRSKWIKTCRPGFRWTFHSLGLVLPAVFANLALFSLYANGWYAKFDYRSEQVFLMTVGLVAMAIIFHPKLNKAVEYATEKWLYLLVSGALIILPFAFPQLSIDVLSAILFIGYWTFIAWLGARMHEDWIVDWSIRLIILRLFIVYIEVFGSMVATGAGLIFSGIILLLILRYQSKIIESARKLVGYDTAK